MGSSIPGEDKAARKARKKERKAQAAAAEAEAAAAMSVDPAEPKEKKQKKKKRDAQAESGSPAVIAEEREDGNSGTAVVDEEDEEEQRRARKKAKKEAKRLAKLQNGSAGAEGEQEEEAGAANGLSKEERKRLKKERKQREAAAAAAAAAPNGPGSGSGSNGKTAAGKSSMSKEEVQAWWEAHEIIVSGNGSENYPPIAAFDQAGFPLDILACTKSFERPTPIQAQCWPVLMGGRDIIGIAETGSGKTLTFSLPGLCRIREAKGTNKAHVPRMLVVAPTRELAMQSAEVLDSCVQQKGINLTSTCLFGGVNKHDQRKALRSGVDIVVATPGRLVDLIEEGECDLSQVTYLVLDEADRMLDQGFEQAIRSIISQCAPLGTRQTALLSATWPQAIQALAQEFLSDPIKVVIGGEDLSSNKRVTQVVEVVGEFDRERLLKSLLQKYHGKRDNRVLVFALYKKEAARLETSLQRAGYACLGIHGDKSQADRIMAVNKFKTKEIPLLIATDVAARGLDIPDVEVVINYSFPLTIEDYVHRIGRTGRAGKTGIAHTFFHQGDKGNAGALVNTLRQADQPVPQELLKFGTAVKKKEHKLYGAFGPKGGEMDMNKKPTKIVFGDDD